MLNPDRSKFLQLIDFNKQIVKANGAYLTDISGQAYLDFTSQYGALPFGGNPSFLQDELVNQIQASPGVMVQPFNSTGALTLAEELSAALPGDLQHVTLACTGAEAVEAAIKLATSSTGRKFILTTHNSFHGKTMGAAMATGNNYYKETFYRSDPAFVHIDYDDIDALEEALAAQSVAAFIVEPIQGEGGMVVPSPGYLQACQQLCNASGTLFVVDEVQSGLGRTGALFACEHDNLEPDIVLLGKALGGGMLPISACVANNKAWSMSFGLRHSSTFANNHFAAHMGSCTIRELNSKSDILANVNNMGQYLSEQLQLLAAHYPLAYNRTSGRGLMQGIGLTPWRCQECYFPGFIYESGYSVALVSSYLLNEHGLLTAPTLNATNVLRIQPNYLVDKPMIDQLVCALRDVAEKIISGDFTAFIRHAMGIRKALPRINMPMRCYPKQPEAGQCKRGVFAFLVHPTSELEAIENLSAKISLFSPDELEIARQWVEGCKSLQKGAVASYHIPRLISKDDGYVEGWLISSLLSPREMMRLSKAEKASLIDSYISQAQSKNADVIGLGAFTSVISRSGTLVENCGTSVTTGNAYTALTSTEAIRTLAKRSNRSLQDLRLGIVGATGSVGRLCLLDVAHECSSVSLIGNARNNRNLSSLEMVAGEFIYGLCHPELQALRYPIAQTLAGVGITQQWIQQYVEGASFTTFQDLFRTVQSTYLKVNGSTAGFPLILSNGVSEALPDCDVIITATSNGEAFIDPETLAQDAMVCDVARPSDLLSRVSNSRDDVVIIEGGLVNLPEKVSIGHLNLVGLREGVSLACLAETIILSMENVSGNYSIGGRSSLSEARKIASWANKHGFSTHVPPTVAQCQRTPQTVPG